MTVSELVSPDSPTVTATAEGDAKPLLSVERLCTTLATPRGPLQAVADVSVSLRAGETLGIVGESGSGKSMLVRSIMDLAPANAVISGRVRIHGRDLATLAKAERKHLWGREIAMIFQDPMSSLNPVRTIGRQITDPLRYHLGLPRREAAARAVELLDLVRIPQPRQRLRQYPHELSGGMRQRVMIAIALSCQPRLLIADEPTTALDVTVQKQVLDLLGNLQAELGMGMILITHDLGIVAGRTERTAVMYAGRLVEIAPTRVLFRSRRHPYTSALLDSIPRLDGDRHSRLRSIEGRPPDLVAPPPGCAFHPRCPRAREACRSERPLLERVDDGVVTNGDGDHRFACFLPLGAGEHADDRPTAAVLAAAEG